MEVIANKTYFIHTWNYITEKREVIVDDIETLEEAERLLEKVKEDMKNVHYYGTFFINTKYEIDGLIFTK